MNKKIRITILIISGIIILLIAKNMIRKNENKVINNEKEEIQEYTPVEELTGEQERETIVSIYYKNKITGELIPEDKRIDSKELIENPCKYLIELLKNNPVSEELESVIPENATINNVSVKGTTAEIDFSKELIDLASQEEITLIKNALLKTLTNLNEIEDIKILIDGKEGEIWNN